MERQTDDVATWSKCGDDVRALTATTSTQRYTCAVADAANAWMTDDATEPVAS